MTDNNAPTPGASGQGGTRSLPLDVRLNAYVAELEITFEEALLGCQKSITVDGRCHPFTIRAGVGNRHRVRLENVWHQRPLIFKIKVRPHPDYERVGQDLYCKLLVSEEALARGGSFPLPGLADRPARQLQIPAGTPVGTRFRLQAQGLVAVGKPNSVGCLYVTVEDDKLGPTARFHQRGRKRKSLVREPETTPRTVSSSPVPCPRLKDESERAFAAFCIYRDLGWRRSLNKAWRAYVEAYPQKNRVVDGHVWRRRPVAQVRGEPCRSSTIGSSVLPAMIWNSISSASMQLHPGNGPGCYALMGLIFLARRNVRLHRVFATVGDREIETSQIAFWANRGKRNGFVGRTPYYSLYPRE